MHWRLATVDRPKAADYAAPAGQQALDSLAPAEATRLFGDAVELLGAGDTARRCRALIGLGEARRLIGDTGYRETLLEASRIASALEDPGLGAAGPVRASGRRAGVLEGSVPAYSGVSAWRGGLADTYCRLGCFERAAAIVQDGARDRFDQVPRDSLRMTALALYASAAAQTGSVAAAETLYELLEPSANQVIYTGVLGYGHARMYLGQLDHPLGRDALALVERVRTLAPDGVDMALDIAGCGILPELIELASGPEHVVTIADFAGAHEHGVTFSTGNAGRAVHALAEIGELIESGRFSLPVAQTFPLEQVAKAHRISEDGHMRGKLVLVV